ncbi:MAG: hypothetical protein AAFR84_01255 [Pseudomonadota bacterium]
MIRRALSAAFGAVNEHYRVWRIYRACPEIRGIILRERGIFFVMWLSWLMMLPGFLALVCIGFVAALADWAARALYVSVHRDFFGALLEQRQHLTNEARAIVPARTMRERAGLRPRQMLSQLPEPEAN